MMLIKYLKTLYKTFDGISFKKLKDVEHTDIPYWEYMTKYYGLLRPSNRSVSYTANDAVHLFPKESFGGCILSSKLYLLTLEQNNKLTFLYYEDKFSKPSKHIEIDIDDINEGIAYLTLKYGRDIMMDIPFRS